MSKLAIQGGTPIRTKPFPSWPQWDERERTNLLRTLETGKWYRYTGDTVERFEKAFAAACGAKHALAVTSGTKALEGAVYALELEPGAEVIVPSYTFVSTATCVINSGYQVVFADVDPQTLNVTAETLEAVRTPKTKAVIPVHFGGLPCDMDAIMAWAKEHQIAVIEDACHAHGGFWDGRALGAIGDLGAFSFQNSKNMTAGEGGIVLTDDETYLGRLFARHSYGQQPGREWYDHFTVSTNLRMTEWAGAILLAQLERLAEQSSKRLENARLLDDAIAGLPGLQVVGSKDPRAAQRAYHLYIYRAVDLPEGVTKAQVMKAMQAEGIPTAAGYPRPLYKQPLFDKVRPAQHQGASFNELALNHVEKVCDEVFWHSQAMLLAERDDVLDIARALEKVFSSIDELRALSA